MISKGVLPLFLVAPYQAAAFAPLNSVITVPSQRNGQRLIQRTHHFNGCTSSGSGVSMVLNNDDEGPGLLTQIGIGLILSIFLIAEILPLLDGGGPRDLSIADSVVTQQDVPGKLQNFESKQDRLSRATIQEKLSGIPVFFLSDGQGSMETSIYLSYADAKTAADKSTGLSVKATSLDQVMYPLILKRGRMRMAPPPIEIAKAEEEQAKNLESGITPKTFLLIPSKVALEQAKQFSMNLAENDIPLFVADRLAFASPNGPQLPLFVDKDDCILSYQRLRNGRESLPEQPNVRSVSLLAELNSMEKGTRPGVSQLAFYATAADVEKATELLQ